MTTLEAAPSLAPSTKKPRLVALVLTVLVVAFLAFDTSLKVLSLAPAVSAAAELGYPPAVFFPLGLVELGCLALYLVPRTAPLGALLWTGYLGGAIATHVRLAHPLFSHTLFPIYVAIALWLPLYLRDPRVRALVAPR